MVPIGPVIPGWSRIFLSVLCSLRGKILVIHCSVKPANKETMKRILLTGMSGTGKSAVIAELAARGYWAVDLDTNEFSHWVAVASVADSTGSPVEPGRDWVWREDRVQALLAAEAAGPLFVSGCAANMGQFLSQFDAVILLSAPAAVIVTRLASRTSNAYGKQPDEVARVLGLLETVEPRLRRAASHEIDTRVSLDQVVAAVLRITQHQSP